MLKWVVERVAGEGEAAETPIGRVPTPGAIDTDGLDLDADTLAELLRVDSTSWRAELPQIEAHYAGIGDSVPAALREQLEALDKRLAAG